MRVPFCLESSASLAGQKLNLIIWDLTSQWRPSVSGPVFLLRDSPFNSVLSFVSASAAEGGVEAMEPVFKGSWMAEPARGDMSGEMNSGSGGRSWCVEMNGDSGGEGAMPSLSNSSSREECQ